MTYNDRLVKLNIESLEMRRLRLDLIYVYKIVFGLVATDMSDYFSLQSTNDYSVITRRENPYKLFVNHCSINARKNFFCERVIKVWNSLPPSIINFESLSSFRNSLNNVNLRSAFIVLFYVLFYLVGLAIFSCFCVFFYC